MPGFPTYDEFKKKCAIEKEGIGRENKEQFWREYALEMDKQNTWSDNAWDEITQDEHTYIDEAKDSEIYEDMLLGAESKIFDQIMMQVPKSVIMKYATKRQLAEIKHIKECKILEAI